MPTAVKSWCRLFPNFEHSWKQSFQKIYKTTLDNKLREFAFKILHKILVTNKELKRFKIKNEDICSQCMNPDSVEHTFFRVSSECKNSIKKSYRGSTHLIALKQICQLSKFYFRIIPFLLLMMTSNANLTYSSCLLKSIYIVVKIKEINLNNSQFINKLKLQWKIENLI